jgi:hypothetical protein
MLTQVGCGAIFPELNLKFEFSPILFLVLDLNRDKYNINFIFSHIPCILRHLAFG